MTGCNHTNTQDETSSNISIEEIEVNVNNQEVEYFTVTKNIPMENRGLKLEIIGSSVYDKIEGEDFTDMPEEGKKYLVLYLGISNRTGKDDYFNYNNIIAKLDGEEITDTFLTNNPENYTSIKTVIDNDMMTQGYLVWEVPENWKKLEVIYTGWTPTYYTEPTIILTPDDLKTPERYKDENRII